MKDRALCFSTKKVLLEKFFKCKLCLKNSIKLIKKNLFAAARVKIFLSPAFPETKVLFFWPNYNTHFAQCLQK